MKRDNEVLDTPRCTRAKGDALTIFLSIQWEREIYTAGTPSGTSNDYAADELPLLSR